MDRRAPEGPVAFVGLGNMGSGMAANLAAHGVVVRAFDLDPGAVRRAAEAGCTPVASAAEAAAGAAAFITMLPAGEAVAAVWREAAFPVLRPGALVVDCSTIDLATTRALAGEAEARGLVPVDAPVSGGIAAAAAGTLTFMVGATDEGFERVQPLLGHMGRAVLRAGGHGAGQAAKLANNLLLAATMVATCEALLLARKLGLDPRAFYEIAARSSGQSWSLTSYCPLPGVGPESPADRGYQGGFATRLMVKDLRLALAAARDAGALTPMGERAAALYEAFAAEPERARLDFSAIIQALA
ncbi:3-hydroxyisobutyrate dehydrogenase [Thermaurantiacus sp.]|uniref:3-hydroxyisobutyrate dehydrogenase n=1 Tax=Thermaurantiacus sp. TaxID=2820283 RepID=UPI00298F04F3|nr:3-hydroxyisobutyrate dehydrogenase [Thermaurantiacus sp.]